MPPGLGRLPLSHVGQWRPGFGIRHAVGGRRDLKARVFDSLRVVARKAELARSMVLLGLGPSPSCRSHFSASFSSYAFTPQASAPPSREDLGLERESQGRHCPISPELRASDPSSTRSFGHLPWTQAGSLGQRHVEDTRLKDLQQVLLWSIELMALGSNVPTSCSKLEGGTYLDLENHPFWTPRKGPRAKFLGVAHS